MKPIFFKPVYKNIIWGGSNISKVFDRDIIGDDIGESWELSAHPSGLSKIESDDINENDLLELFNNKKLRESIFGKDCLDMERFPILIKIIDAHDKLSIQVHPDDDYAFAHENDSGKTEVWYILDCKKGAKIIYGLKDDIDIKDAINNIEENVKYVDVHKGDFISIPAGTVHAIMDGIMLLEVQQSSDVTYRVYDWNRVDKNGNPRHLHIQKALDVINPASNSKIYNYDNLDTNTNIYKSNIFSIDMINVSGKLNDKSSKDSFYAYFVIDGEGSFTSSSYNRKLKKGTTFMIPSSLGTYSLVGNMKLMKIYM